MPFNDVPDGVRRRMSSIRKTGSKPEVLVRSIAHKLGYRFRINRRDLPGTPDVVFPGRKKVILVHGCFWHQHPGCKQATRPKVRTEYWLPKLARNVARDAEVRDALRALGWQVLTLWECELHPIKVLEDRLESFLGQPASTRKNSCG